MERYTRTMAVRAFERLGAALGKPFEPMTQAWHTLNGRNVSTPGVWMLDTGPYGFRVAMIANEMGGEEAPLGYTRRTAREFCQSVEFAMDALRTLDPNGHEKRMQAYYASEHFTSTWGKRDAKRMEGNQ